MSIIEPKGEAVTRSFRIDKAWDKALYNMAEESGVSISGLLEIIVRDYLLFYRWAEDLESVIISPTTIRGIMEALDEEQLRKIAEKVSTATFELSYLERGDELSLHTVMFQINEQMGRYAHWFDVEDHLEDADYIYIKNKLGEKWSIFVEAYLTNLISKIGDVNVKTERTGQDIVIRVE